MTTTTRTPKTTTGHPHSESPSVGVALYGQGRRLAFEGGGDVDVAHALRVGQSACAGAEAEIGEVRAAEELGSDVAGERRSHGLAIEGVGHGLRGRIPGDDDGMPRPVLDIGQ